jgi:hypothetical protein
VIQLAADDWLLEQIMTFDAGSEGLEDGDEDEAPAVLSFDRVPPRQIYRGRSTLAAGSSP